MKANRKTDTRPELALRSALHARGLRYRTQLPVRLPDRRPTRPDIVFTRAKLAVFVDGCFWHVCPDHQTHPASNRDYWGPKLARNVTRDRETDTALAAAGWTVIRVWEHEPVAAAAYRVTAAYLKLVECLDPLRATSARSAADRGGRREGPRHPSGTSTFRGPARL